MSLTAEKAGKIYALQKMTRPHSNSNFSIQQFQKTQFFVSISSAITINTVQEQSFRGTIEPYLDGTFFSRGQL